MNTNAPGRVLLGPGQQGEELKHYPLLPGKTSMFDVSDEGKAEARKVHACRLHVGFSDYQHGVVLTPDLFSDAELSSHLKQVEDEIRELEASAKAGRDEVTQGYKDGKPAAVAELVALRAQLEATLERVASFMTLDARAIKNELSSLESQVRTARPSLKELHEWFPGPSASLRLALEVLQAEKGKRSRIKAQRKREIHEALAEAGIQLAT